MILKDRGPLNPQSLAEELLRQRDVLRQHRETISAIQARVIGYEERFSLLSDDVHGAIEHGILHETAEVCDWIIDHDLLRRARTAQGR